MADRIWFLIPEFILLAGAIVCVLCGYSRISQPGQQRPEYGRYCP